MMIIGTWDAHLDPSGRLILPNTFRAIATEGLTLTRGFERCLQAFPAKTWHTLARHVSDLPLSADAARVTRRLIFGGAAGLALDDAGALTIPQLLLAYAEISTAVVLVGMDTYFELWSPEGWQIAANRLLSAPLALGAANIPPIRPHP